MSVTMLELIMDLSVLWFYTIISSTLKEIMASIKKQRQMCYSEISFSEFIIFFSLQLTLTFTLLSGKIFRCIRGQWVGKLIKLT